VASTARVLVVLRRCEAILLHSPDEVAGILVLPVLDQVRGLVEHIEDSVLAPRKKRGVVAEEEDETPDLFDAVQADVGKTEKVSKVRREKVGLRGNGVSQKNAGRAV
jgi:hypothetical protein